MAAAVRSGVGRQHPAAGVRQDRRCRKGPLEGVRHNHRHARRARRLPRLSRPRDRPEPSLYDHEHLRSQRRRLGGRAHQLGQHPCRQPDRDPFRLDGAAELPRRAEHRQRRLFRRPPGHQHARRLCLARECGGSRQDAGCGGALAGRQRLHLAHAGRPQVAGSCRPPHHRRHAFRQRAVVCLGRRRQVQPKGAPLHPDRQDRPSRLHADR